jgi:hypothetical protein
MMIYEKNGKIVSVDEETGTLLSVAKLVTDSVSVSLDDDSSLFLKSELDIEIGASSRFESGEDVANEVIRRCFVIESEEVLKCGDGELSERGKTAMRIIDLIHCLYEKPTF